MRSAIFLVSASALMLSACGPKKLALPADPIDKAASCAVVSAAEARLRNPDTKGDLDFDAQTRIIHYAMLAGIEGEGFSTKNASAVVSRMSEVEADITNGKWQDLVAPCDQAFPEVKKTSGIALPEGRFDAQLGCYAMADFLVKTVTTTDPKAQDRFAAFQKMKRDLDGSIGATMKARGAGSYERTLDLKQGALVRMTRLGAPAEVMTMCTERFD
ncbi:hypothetical protein [Sphingomonas sp. SRS2]|uniref:hypothetical protein n=1 Tax=Sphingomonas sp. SRS2 TaxID=133190 RepID=UPI00061847F4|nr:hypothetical protein [Sphingomonas sp. SRS2]KKC26884.1 hypothetical protein WP12_06085 [Sphingomonas sp. SRS2]